MAGAGPAQALILFLAEEACGIKLFFNWLLWGGHGADHEVYAATDDGEGQQAEYYHF